MPLAGEKLVCVEMMHLNNSKTLKLNQDNYQVFNTLKYTELEVRYLENLWRLCCYFFVSEIPQPFLEFL